MTLRIMKSDRYSSNEGRRICVMIANSFDERGFVDAFIDRFTIEDAKIADIWDFSYHNPNWEWIEKLLPVQIRDDIDNLAHDAPGKPHTWMYSFEYHANYS